MLPHAEPTDVERTSIIVIILRKSVFVVVNGAERNFLYEKSDMAR